MFSVCHNAYIIVFVVLVSAFWRSFVTDDRDSHGPGVPRAPWITHACFAIARYFRIRFSLVDGSVLFVISVSCAWFCVLYLHGPD